MADVVVEPEPPTETTVRPQDWSALPGGALLGGPLSSDQVIDYTATVTDAYGNPVGGVTWPSRS
ncbi:hypothetical protein BRD13_08060 [Halobacteriales archaeon SW_5_70_135]|nr:MAG: hypothetical protein BRD13_08060 [Halobacteriales archaeon SW_5_70_135]